MADAELHIRAGRLMAEALEVEPQLRPAWLDVHCGSDTILRTRVERLLRDHEAAEQSGFLETPAGLQHGPRKIVRQGTTHEEPPGQERE